MPLYYPVGGDSDYLLSGGNVYGNGIVYSVSPTGTGNVALSSGIMADLTSGANNVGIGDGALNAITTGNGNIALGLNALSLVDTGTNNVAIGSASLSAITTKINNIAIGVSSLERGTEIGENVAIGIGALQNGGFNAGGQCYYNVVLGNAGGDLGNHIPGNYNVIIGYKAMTGNGLAGTESNNVCVGAYAGILFNGSGNTDNNVALGYLAGGATLQNPSNCTFLGTNATSTLDPVDHSSAVGADATITKNNQVMLGTSADKVSIPGGLEIDAAAANPIIGTATLVGGTVTVNTSKVTANSKIFLSHQTANHASANIDIQNIVAGVSFDIVSTNGTDTSVINWLLIEPT